MGVILDSFSSLAFQFEWDQVSIAPETWQEQLEEEPLDFLFVESAWHGNDGTWRYQITGPNAPSDTFRKLMDYCSSKSIPTIFWNKEDPVHFDDFIDSARLFDRVYTTDSSRIPAYHQFLGHDRVGLLPFGAQPRIHNPIRPPRLSEKDLRDVAFAGTYFRDKYIERREQMDMILGGAIDIQDRLKNGGLDIFSRFSAGGSQYSFPSPFAEHVVGETSYEQMLTLYRSYKTFINVNSVVDSPTMCARRVFEISACGTPVVTGQSKAIPEFFKPGMVFEIEDRASAGMTIRALNNSPELRDKATHAAQLHIWRNHTYEQRVNQILADINMPEKRSTLPTVTAMVSTNRPYQLPHVIKQMAQQRDVDLQVILLTHGFEPSVGDRALATHMLGDHLWLQEDQDVSLGQCYNLMAQVADGVTLAKIDDDDIYLPDYLFDQLNTMDYSQAEVVGKSAHYVYLKDQGITVLRFPQSELHYTHFVSGPTIVTRKEVVLANPFPEEGRGEDSGFLRAVRHSGGKIFSGNRFEFVQVRSRHGTHTWSIDDVEILASGVVQPDLPITR